MQNPIQKLHEAFNLLKGFESAHTSSNQKDFLVKIEDKVYKLSIEELDEKELTVETVEKYLK